ncbi:MAG: hypothetical protein ABH824_03810 [Nanoarchaeota archaeon]|nr:hypothetical protein [Nanoarchaeota archaeon]MBU1631822.1 hypothetical protein [Nanoarchaeota archaeon]MBU1876146.1 hypothetical protein [Nanoarchaeota archaeon]
MPKYLVGLVEPKTYAIFKTLLNNPNKIFHLNSLAEASKVPTSSTARIIRKLVINKFAEELKIGKISIYKLADNEKIKKLKSLDEK